MNSKTDIQRLLLSLLVLSAMGVSVVKAQLPTGYKGLPYKDSVYTGNKLNPYGAQNIPGRVELAYYDRGGEGIAFHDNTEQNEGAVRNKIPGEKRPGISDYIAYFRKNEGVDMDYTKDTLDFTSSDRVSPKPGQLYIGRQDAGEWANYTIYVHQKGKYIIYTSYSSTENNPAELWINTAFAGKLTFHEKTGNQHTWTQSEAGEISFPHAGVYLLTLKFGTGVNYGYLDFLYNDARQ